MGIQPGVSITAPPKVSRASWEPGLQIIPSAWPALALKEGIPLLNHGTSLQCQLCLSTALHEKTNYISKLTIFQA